MGGREGNKVLLFWHIKWCKVVMSCTWALGVPHEVCVSWEGPRRALLPGKRQNVSLSEVWRCTTRERPSTLFWLHHLVLYCSPPAVLCSLQLWWELLHSMQDTWKPVPVHCVPSTTVVCFSIRAGLCLAVGRIAGCVFPSPCNINPFWKL